MTKSVVGFGEVMARISPPGQNSFGDSREVLLTAGGSEANVLAKVGCLARGIETQLITRLKDDLVGRALRADMQAWGVGLEHVIWTDQDRNGVYYLEQGLGPISASVSYDRAGSAIARAGARDFDWSSLAGAQAFFVSGITPALSDSCRQATGEALQAAQNQNVWTFCDVNYRNKLWSPQDACKTLSDYINQGLISVLITTETDAKKVFNIDCGVDDESDMASLIEQSKNVLTEFSKKYPQTCKVWILTVRKRITNESGQWTCVACLGDQEFFVGDVFDYIILDRPGAGDACSAGIIGGFLGAGPEGDLQDNHPLSERIKTGLDLGNRMAVVAQKTVGDFGPHWSAAEFFQRVSENKEISR